MDKKYDQLNIHQKMELLISELVEKEVRFRDALREFQKIYLETSAKKCKANKTIMAKLLGIHRNTLHNLVKSLKIKRLPGR
jgi:DNA-binding NtrC family response regulator